MARRVIYLIPSGARNNYPDAVGICPFAFRRGIVSMATNPATTNAEFAPKLVGDMLAALRPLLRAAPGGDASSSLRSWQEEPQATAEEKKILERIGNAREVRDKPSLCKLLSEISEDAQKEDKVGIPLKVFAETIRCVVQSDDRVTVDPDSGAPTASLISQPNLQQTMDDATRGFGVGARAGQLVGGGMGAVEGGLVGGFFGGGAGVGPGAAIGGAVGGMLLGMGWGAWGAVIGAAGGAILHQK
jgi:hypothetical protein